MILNDYVKLEVILWLNIQICRYENLLTIKGIFKVGSAIPAQIEREAVKVGQSSGKMHQAFLILTVLQVEKMPQFMQGDFGGAIVQAGLRYGRTIQVMPESVQRDDRMPASLAGLAVYMVEYRYKNIDIQNSHDFQAAL